MTSDVSEAPQWQKILWKEQDFPDNHVPDSFLSSLRRNTNVRLRTYPSLVIATLPIVQHASAVFLFIAVFIQLRGEELDPRFLIWGCLLGYGVGFVLWELPAVNDPGGQERSKQRAKTMKSSLLVFLALMALTPILRTLTEATSSDSIWALSALLFILNMLIADYSGPPPGPDPRLSGSKGQKKVESQSLTSVLSMNAAISASVVLASRLRSNLAVFALVLLAVLLFALLPSLRREIKRFSPPIQSSITVLMASSALIPFSRASTTGTVLVLGVFLFIAFVCPALLVWAQRYKNEIRGPWDPAVPVVNSTDGG